MSSRSSGGSMEMLQQHTRDSSCSLAYTIIGEGDDAVIMAYGTGALAAIGVPHDSGSLNPADDDYDDHKTQQNEGDSSSWTCATCTLVNTDNPGSTCTLCGAERLAKGVLGDSSTITSPTRMRMPKGAKRSAMSKRALMMTERDAACIIKEDDTDEHAWKTYSDDSMEDDDGILPYSPSLSPGQFSAVAPVSSRRLSGSSRRNSSRSMMSTGSGRRRSSLFERSFSLLSLVEDMPSPQDTVAGGGTRPAPSLESFHSPGTAPTPASSSSTDERLSPLTEREFQMSFANWSISDNQAWACDGCTFVNTNPLHLTCEVCGQARPTEPSEDAEDNYQISSPQAARTYIATDRRRRSFQQLMSSSIRSGQQDFLRRQQEIMEQVEDRVLGEDRLREISNLQQEVLQSYNEVGVAQEQQSAVGTTEAASHQETQSEDGASVQSNFELLQKANEADDYIRMMEELQQQEEQDQERMERILQQREVTSRSTTSPSEGGGPTTASSTTTSAARSSTLSTTSTREHHQVTAQRRMLSQWRQSSGRRNADIAAIRQRQQDIFDRLQGDL